MKKSIYFLLLLVSVVSCVQNKEKLPKQPWEEIVEINSNEDEPLKKWTTNINVGMYGNTIADSIVVSKIIKKLDALTETVSITFTNVREPSNLRIHFFNQDPFSFIDEKNRITSSPRNTEIGIIDAELHIFKDNDDFQQKLESKFINTIVTGHFFPPKEKDKRPSAFNRTTVDTITYEKDISIIKELYAEGFEERLELAKKQFKSIVEEARSYRVSQRKKTIWWVKTPIAVIFFPTLVLVLFFIFLTSKIKHAIQIKNELLRFTVLSFAALLFAGFVIVFCVSFYDFLTIPNDYTKVPIVRKDTIVSTIAALVPLFPFLFLFRLIEFKIQKSSQNIFIKTILVFLSTGVLPFLCIVIAFLFALNRKGDLQGGLFFLSQVFLVLMSVAFLRALISYFIFKERSLVIENEKKLSNLKELKSKAELKSLQSQINPHFLYNSLNSIASLAPIDSKRTQEMAHSLSDLFKYSINRKGKKMSIIKDEINMVNTYLSIEKIRFGERLKFVVEVDKAIENYEIPLFLIQPLIENAVKHGISKQAGNGEIRLKIKEEKNELIITVSDSGPNFPKGLVSGHGLQTVYDLLRLSYGDKASLNWTNLPEKTITITMPKKQ